MPCLYIFLYVLPVFFNTFDHELLRKVLIECPYMCIYHATRGDTKVIRLSGSREEANLLKGKGMFIITVGSAPLTSIISVGINKA